ncbi:MAG: MBL fold metallo-hydrolase [Candidatus Bipolaricaulia bacterium]
MHIRTFTLTDYQSNCYVVTSEGQSLVIDPGAADPSVLEAVAGTDVVAVLNTHAHPDHIGGNPELKRQLDVPLMLHKADRAWWRTLLGDDIPLDRFIAEGETIDVGDVSLEVMHTPGHCPGQVILLDRDERIVFSGDLIFAGSVGRTDFPGGSDEQMSESLQRLDTLHGDWSIYPGHGPATTLEQERRSNPFLLDLR